MLSWTRRASFYLLCVAVRIRVLARVAWSLDLLLLPCAVTLHMPHTTGTKVVRFSPPSISSSNSTPTFQHVPSPFQLPLRQHFAWFPNGPSTGFIRSAVCASILIDQHLHLPTPNHLHQVWVGASQLSGRWQMHKCLWAHSVILLSVLLTMMPLFLCVQCRQQSSDACGVASGLRQFHQPMFPDGQMSIWASTLQPNTLPKLDTKSCLAFVLAL